jgi:hypothetical protein
VAKVVELVQNASAEGRVAAPSVPAESLTHGGRS